MRNVKVDVAVLSIRVFVNNEPPGNGGLIGLVWGIVIAVPLGLLLGLLDSQESPSNFCLERSGCTV